MVYKVYIPTITLTLVVAKSKSDLPLADMISLIIIWVVLKSGMKFGKSVERHSVLIMALSMPVIISTKFTMKSRYFLHFQTQTVFSNLLRLECSHPLRRIQSFIEGSPRQTSRGLLIIVYSFLWDSLVVLLILLYTTKGTNNDIKMIHLKRLH